MHIRVMNRLQISSNFLIHIENETECGGEVRNSSLGQISYWPLGKRQLYKICWWIIYPDESKLIEGVYSLASLNLQLSLLVDAQYYFIHHLLGKLNTTERWKIGGSEFLHTKLVKFWEGIELH